MRINQFVSKTGIALYIINLLLIANAFAQTPVKINYGNDTIMVYPSDNAIGIKWNNGNYILTNAISLINGKTNTTNIVAKQGIGNYAAYSCDTLNAFGFSDWYLPSKDELNTLYLNKNTIGNFSTNLYWSSSEVNDSTAWNQNFSDGTQGSSIKMFGDIRCVRHNPYPTITDIDSNTYNTVKIGTQTWMKENLKTTKYNNGTTIPNLTVTTDWAKTTSGAYSNYKNTNNIDTINTYGRLYNWYTVNSFKLCPTGWHIPNRTDWNTLIKYIGDTTTGADKLKEANSSHWSSPNTGAINSFDFTALPGGTRTNNGSMIDMGISGTWWWADEFDVTSASFCSMNYNQSNIFNYRAAKIQGMSVRCIKGEAVNATAPFNTKIDSTTKTVYLKDSSNTGIVYWNLGNGSISTENNPVAIYKSGGFYRVTESVLDTNANTIFQTEKLININNGTKDCEAEFKYSINSTYNMVQFTNTSLGTNLTNYLWNFGDTLTSTTASPAHTYTKDNYYNVCLTAMSNTCKNITCKTLKSGTDITKENTAFIFVTAKNQNKVYFNDKSTAATKWLWTFGDGTTSTTQHPQHIYADTGLYHVVLEINNATDVSQIYNALVNVHSNITSLKAIFVSKETKSIAKGVLPIEFKGTGYGDATQVEWNFGDGTTNGSSMTPIHEYAQAGKYKVCMSVYDSLAYQTFTYCDTIEIGLVGINHSSLTINNSEFEMYPNPAKQSLVISIKSLENSNTEEKIIITNTLGQTVFTNYYRLATNYSINVSQFHRGVYFVRIGNSVKKLIIN